MSERSEPVCLVGLARAYQAAVSSGHVRSIKILSETVADAPAASTAERPAALCCSGGPGPRAGRTCAAATDARPTTSTPAAHRDSGECSGRVSSRSLSWAARTCAAKSVQQRAAQSIACSAAQNHKRARRVPGGAEQWLQRAVPGATFNMGCCWRATRWLRKPQSKNTHAGARPRTHVRAHAQTHPHLQKRAGDSVAAQTSKQKHARTGMHARRHARMRAHALPHTHLQSTTHTRANSTRTCKLKHTRTYTHAHTHTHSHGTHTQSHGTHGTHTHTHTHTHDTNTHYTHTRTHIRREREAKPHAGVSGVRAVSPREAVTMRGTRHAERLEAEQRPTACARAFALDAHCRMRGASSAHCVCGADGTARRVRRMEPRRSAAVGCAERTR